MEEVSLVEQPLMKGFLAIPRKDVSCEGCLRRVSLQALIISGNLFANSLLLTSYSATFGDAAALEEAHHHHWCLICEADLPLDNV